MGVKSQLLRLLMDNRCEYISGETLAHKLVVSRNAIWKAVESLRAEGYRISAMTNKGYRLEENGDIITEAGLTGFIKNTGVFQVDIRKSVTSSNSVLRELASKGAPEGYVLIAEEQTAGKGRLGRSFHSPGGHGVYFSLLLRPGDRAFGSDHGPQSAISGAGDTSLITAAAAVATAQAIEEFTGVHAGIKWVNDLFVNGKKVCGILTEAVFSMESGMMESAVLGIGINITRAEEGFPEMLEGIAGTLTDRATGGDGERCRIIAATLDYFWKYYKSLSSREFLDEYRERSIVTGRDIMVLSGGGQRIARALYVDDNCGLVVRYEDGETATLVSGEVSIRQQLL